MRSASAVLDRLMALSRERLSEVSSVLDEAMAKSGKDRIAVLCEIFRGMVKKGASANMENLFVCCVLFGTRAWRVDKIRNAMVRQKDVEVLAGRFFGFIFPEADISGIQESGCQREARDKHEELRKTKKKGER